LLRVRGEPAATHLCSFASDVDLNQTAISGELCADAFNFSASFKESIGVDSGKQLDRA